MLPHLTEFVSSSNRDFSAEQRTFEARSTAAREFLAKRRETVNGLVQALREHTPTASNNGCLQGPHMLSAVPTAWLSAFLNGTDRRIEDLIDDNQRLLPEDRWLADVSYGRTLLRSPGKTGLVVDPLAIWCGEVKFVPKAALDALQGAGGLDSGLFHGLDVSRFRGSVAQSDGHGDKAAGDSAPSEADIDTDSVELLGDGREVCKAAWHLFRSFVQEWLHIGQILQEGKVSLQESRALQDAGRGGEAVWVASKVQKHWQRVAAALPSGAGRSAGKAQPSQIMALRSFLAEVHSSRFATSAPSEEVEEELAAGAPAQGGGAAAAADQEQRAGAEESQSAEESGAAAAPLQQLVGADHFEVNLTEGLLCPHGLICRPRSGFLARRADVEKLLELAASKEQAYKCLWPDARAVPRVRTGLPGNALLGPTDVCTQCRAGNALGLASSSVDSTGGAAGTAGAPGGAPGAGAAQATQRKLLVRQRYPSGVVRKKGTLALPAAGDSPIKGAALRALVRTQLSLPVAHLWVLRGCEGGPEEEVELQDGDTLEDRIEKVVVQKDEATPPAVEATAFQGSVFRGGHPNPALVAASA